MLYDLINILIKDPYVSNADKNFLNKLLKESKEREKEKKNMIVNF